MYIKCINKESEMYDVVVEVYSENAIQYQYWWGPDIRCFTKNKMDWIEVDQCEYDEQYDQE